MRILIFLLVLYALFHVAVLFKLAFAVIFLTALAIGLWVLWRLKWVILGVLGLEELFGDR